jgi:hypothetical protein
MADRYTFREDALLTQNVDDAAIAVDAADTFLYHRSIGATPVDIVEFSVAPVAGSTVDLTKVGYEIFVDKKYAGEWHRIDSRRVDVASNISSKQLVPAVRNMTVETEFRVGVAVFNRLGETEAGTVMLSASFILNGYTEGL